MVLKLNPVTGELDLVGASGGAAGATDLTGDVGTAVSPDGSDNIDLIGDATQAFIQTTGTPASNKMEIKLVKPAVDGQLLIGHTANGEPSSATLTAGSGVTIVNGAGAVTISSTASSALVGPTDSGTATAVAGSMDFFGGTGVDTVGSGNTITINASAAVPTAFTTDSGTGTPAGNSLAVLGGAGVDTSGSGATLTITAAATVSTSFPTDSGTATPAANALTVAGGTGINTSGSSSTVTVNIDSPVTVANGGTERTSHTAYAVIAGGTTSTAAQQSIASVGTAGQLLTSNGAGALPTFQAAAASQFAWNSATSATQAIVGDNGYILDRALGVTATLPATCAVGDVFRIVVITLTTPENSSIAQNASQTIHFGNQDTTPGVGGSLAPTLQYDAIAVLCTTTNTDFTVISSIGNWTIV